jgi:hypothetical protein
MKSRAPIWRAPLYASVAVVILCALFLHWNALIPIAWTLLALMIVRMWGYPAR